MAKQGNKFLYLRGEFWNYKRNVPLKFEHIEPRKRIRAALNTQSLDVARLRRDALVEAEDAYWTALSLQADASGGITDTTRQVQEHQYKAASKRALSFGFIYKTARQLTTETPVDNLMERVELLAAQYKNNQPPPKMETTALLGGISKPAPEAMRVSAAFKLYVNKIAFDAQLKKSPAQKRSWEKAKQTSIDYFIAAIADMDMGDITREQALNYRNWWADRIKSGDEDGNRPTPYTANRHVGNMRTLYREFFEYQGEEDRPNPFRKLSFKEDRKTKKKRPPFETDWIAKHILAPNIFSGLNPQARHILYALIETGARPSEICNLRPENIRLGGDVPYLAIREKENREIKADASDRDIPLVGVSLAAMKANPNGFPRYFDKETSLSAILMKALKSRDLLPTENHKVYSIRHSFEKRMLEAGLDYGLRCKLMGHKNDRPEYGDGGSLEYRRSEMLKIVLPYDGWEI